MPPVLSELVQETVLCSCGKTLDRKTLKKHQEYLRRVAADEHHLLFTERLLEHFSSVGRLRRQGSSDLQVLVIDVTLLALIRECKMERLKR